MNVLDEVSLEEEVTSTNGSDESIGSDDVSGWDREELFP